MREKFRIPADGSEPRITDTKEDIHFCEVVSTKYGTKVAIQSDYSKKDDIKSLDWDRTHRSWNDSRKMWMVDIRSLNLSIENLCGMGNDVSIEIDVVQDFEKGYGGQTKAGREFLPSRKEDTTEKEEGETNEESRDIDDVDEGDTLKVVYESVYGDIGNRQEIELEATDTSYATAFEFEDDDGVRWTIEIDGDLADEVKKDNKHGNPRMTGHVQSITVEDNDDDERERAFPTVDSDPGPAGCEMCGDVYTKIGKANRGVCPDCWSEMHDCLECGDFVQPRDDLCDDCSNDQDTNDEEQLVTDGGQEQKDIKVRFTGKARRMYGSRELTPAYEDGVESAEIAWEPNNRQKTQLVIDTEEEAKATLKHLNRHLDRCEETGPYGTVWAAPGMAKAVRRVIETIESEMSGRRAGEGEESTEEPTEQSESKSDDTPDHEIELSDEAASAIQTAFNEQEKYSTGRDYHPSNDPTVHVHDREMVIEVLEYRRDKLEKYEGEATLFDPNGEDVHLSWVRTAIAEVSEDTEKEVMTDGGEPADVEYDVIWDLQKRWDLSFGEAELFLENIGYFDYLDNRYQYHLYEQFSQMLENCNHGDLEGMPVYIDYLSAPVATKQ